MKIKALMASVLVFLGLKDMPIENGAINFSEKDLEKLNGQFTEKTVKEMVKAFNTELKGSEQVQKIQAELDNLLENSNLSEEEIKKVTQAKDASQKEGAEGTEMKSILEKLNLLDKSMKEQSAIIKKLEGQEIGDAAMKVIKNGNLNEKAKHSATHLFGNTKAYNAFEGRPWNKMAAGIQTGAIDFTDELTVEKLNGDVSLFYRENPKGLVSLFRDKIGLPSHWPTRTKVVDNVSDGTIATSEVTQARKLPWLSKNNQLIKPETGKVYPVSIDLEWAGHVLSKQLESWLANFNHEGSQAYKTSFVQYLLSEIDKQARLEDRVASIGGIYVPTPDNATVAGKFINRQNGLLYILWKALHVDKKYRAFDLGIPTTNNIVDYIDKFIKSLPDDVRRMQGLEFGLSPAWRAAYNKRTEQTSGMNNNYDGYPKYPKDYPNISFTELVDLEGTDIMFITTKGNIEILENLPKEKGLYKFEYLKRMIYVLGDYKFGIWMKHIGNKVADNAPEQFKVQTVWTNNVPFFDKDFFIPVHDDKTGIVDVIFNQLQVTADFVTDITKLENLVPGMIIKVRGNTEITVAKNLKKNADNLLVSDFDLSTGGTITMFVQPDGKLKELTRTTAPEAAAVTEVNFDGNVIDANEGEVFKYVGTADVTLASIVNGVEGKVIKIYGNATNAFTIDDVTGNVNVVSTYVLDTAAKYMELVNVSGVWIETSRA